MRFCVGATSEMFARPPFFALVKKNMLLETWGGAKLPSSLSPLQFTLLPPAERQGLIRLREGADCDRILRGDSVYTTEMKILVGTPAANPDFDRVETGRYRFKNECGNWRISGVFALLPSLLVCLPLRKLICSLSMVRVGLYAFTAKHSAFFLKTLRVFIFVVKWGFCRFLPSSPSPPQ